MVPPAMPQQHAGPCRTPVHSTRPVSLRGRRALLCIPHAQSTGGFFDRFTFTNEFPFISFGGKTDEGGSIPEVKPPPPAPVTAPVPVTNSTSSFAPPDPNDDIDLTEAGEIELPVGGFTIKQVFPELTELRQEFGPLLPVDQKYTEWSPANPELRGMSFKSKYDEGYCGHFSLPGEADMGAAATFQNVMAQEDPFTFIAENLTATPTRSSDLTGDELVIFTPGLRTYHDTSAGGQETAPARLQHYADTLGCSLAQLHIGTDTDQGDVALSINFSASLMLRSPPMQQKLNQLGLDPKEINNDSVIFWPGQRDKIEAGLTVMGFTRPLFQDHIIEMLKFNETARRPLVLMPYSRTAVEMTTALKKYIASYDGPEDVEALLRETLTVVSLGNGTKPYGWPNGPAYVHVGGWSEDQTGPPPAPGEQPVRGTDEGVFWEGVYDGSEPAAAAGADAVYVHSDWVWSGREAHNFASAGSASLRLVLAMNKVTGFRELYNRLREGEVLERPTFEQVKAAIVLTDATKWMWNKGDGPWVGVELPSREEAEKLVGEWI